MSNATCAVTLVLAAAAAALAKRRPVALATVGYSRLQWSKTFGESRPGSHDCWTDTAVHFETEALVTTWVLQWLLVRTAPECMDETLPESRASTILPADLDHSERISVMAAAAAAAASATVPHWPTVSATAVVVGRTDEVNATACSPRTLMHGTDCFGRLG
jgi:hypothetical protein